MYNRSSVTFESEQPSSEQLSVSVDIMSSTTEQEQQEQQGGWITIRVSHALIPRPSSEWSFLVLVGCHAGHDTDTGTALYRERDRDASQTRFGGGDDSVYDTNVIDLLAPNVRRRQRDMIYSYCASERKFASVVPYGGVVQSTYGSDNAMSDLGGNGCFASPSKVTPTRRYSALRQMKALQYPVLDEYLLRLQNPSDSSFGDDIMELSLTVTRVSAHSVRVKITDAQQQRFEPPHVLVYEERDNPEVAADYHVVLNESPFFGITVVRQSDNAVLFDSMPLSVASDSAAPPPPAQFRDLVFKDHYLELSTRMSDDYQIYGLGERVHEFRLFTDNQVYSQFAMDRFTPYQRNLYGAHPFYLQMHPDGTAHGVYLHNNHGLDVELAPNKLTYRIMGGDMDLFFFTGPTPERVIRQYHQLIGYPALPPYWALGFHQCRWGYETIRELEEVALQYRRHQLPLDTLWSGIIYHHLQLVSFANLVSLSLSLSYCLILIDIDYMDEKRLFTLDPVNYPETQVREFVDYLHEHQQHYVIIVDPGVRFEPGYSVYEAALESNVLIRDREHDVPALGKVWPGATAFPDWTHPNASRFWASQIQAFYARVPFDGLWIDMNEIASFCDGHCVMDRANAADWADLFTCPCQFAHRESERDHPPFWAGGLPPDSSTISMESRWYNDTLEYDWHSLYGHLESIATSTALRELTGKRPFVITRSSYASTGHHVGHWLGDNSATWFDMRMSIAGMLNMNMFGIPLIGADICGFVGDTEEELCARWMQLGSMYPFSRNHNGLDFRSQEPYALGDTVLAASVASLRLRYSLLPYLYSQLHHVTRVGGMLVRPLMFHAPNDTVCRNIDTQFLLGDSLLVSPVLEAGATSVRAYFPAGIWYHLLSGAPSTTNRTKARTGHYATVPAPLEGAPPVHLAGGSIIVMNTEPALTTAAARQLPLHMVVAFSLDLTASGFLVLDDGESLESPESHFAITALLSPSTKVHRAWETTGELQVTVTRFDYQPPPQVVWKSIVIHGIPSHRPPDVHIAGLKHEYISFDESVGALTIFDINLPLSTSFAVTWVSLNDSNERPLSLPYAILMAVVLVCGLAALAALAVFAYRRRNLFNRNIPPPSRRRQRAAGAPGSANNGFSLVDSEGDEEDAIEGDGTVGAVEMQEVTTA